MNLERDACRSRSIRSCPGRAKNEAKKCLPRPAPFEVVHYTNADGRDVIDAWLSGLRDQRAVARMAARMERLELGLLGDCRSVKDGVMELRIDYGPGYRVYFAPIQQHVILLLGGGTKGTQQADIAEAKARLKNWRSRP